jgi:hypothetical protein
MSRTKVMLIGALPVGSVNPRNPSYPSGGPGPSWQTNFITSATTVSEVPQNLMRNTNNGSPPYRQSSVGSRAVPLETRMLGRLGATSGVFDRGEAYVFGAEDVAAYNAMVANSDPLYVESSQRLIKMLIFGQRIMGGSVGAYHGYKRNRGAMGPAIAWGVCGAIFPMLTVGVGLFQGLAQPKR